MAGKLYVTDSPVIQKMIEREGGEWVSIQGISTYRERNDKKSSAVKPLPDRMILLKPEQIIDGSFLSVFESVIEEEKRRNALLINAFSPSEKGSILFQLFLQYSGFEESGLCKRNRYFGEADGRERSINLSEKKRAAEAMKIWLWTKRTVNSEVTKILDQSGFAVDYDLFQIPLCAEIENRRKEITDFVCGTQSQLSAKGRIGDTVLTLQLCDETGKILQAPEYEMKGLEGSVHTGKVIRETRTERTFMPPQPYDFLSLLQDLETEVIRPADAEEYLMKMYAEGFTNYPLSGERKVNQALLGRMAKKQDLSFFSGRKKEWNPLTTDIDCEKKETAGGIVMLHHPNLEDLYDQAVDKEKPVLDLLIRRQLAILSQPAKIEVVDILIEAEGYHFTGKIERLAKGGWRSDSYGELEQDTELYLDREVSLSAFEVVNEPMPKLYTVSSLITFLRIHAIDNDCIFDILHSIGLPQPGYIGYYDGKYLLRRADRERIEKLPDCIKSLSLATDLLAEVQRVRNGKIGAEQYMEMVKKSLAKIEEEIKRSAVRT